MRGAFPPLCVQVIMARCLSYVAIFLQLIFLFAFYFYFMLLHIVTVTIDFLIV
jgi:hypothetical protein